MGVTFIASSSFERIAIHHSLQAFLISHINYTIRTGIRIVTQAFYLLCPKPYCIFTEYGRLFVAGGRRAFAGLLLKLAREGLASAVSATQLARPRRTVLSLSFRAPLAPSASGSYSILARAPLPFNHSFREARQARRNNIRTGVAANNNITRLRRPPPVARALPVGRQSVVRASPRCPEGI